MLQPSFIPRRLHVDWNLRRLYTILLEELLGDAMRINQILINILSNAGKFTPENGRVPFDVKSLSGSGEVKLRFTVSDTGRGMSEEFLQKLYGPFEQENTIGGTGFKMPITKNLAGLFNGTVSVKSSPGEGEPPLL